MDKDVIRQIIVEYQEFVKEVKVEKRDLTIESTGNYVFTGVRRAGKTFSMLQVIKSLLKDSCSLEQILYVNFEDERLIELKVTDLGLLIDVYKELYNVKPVLFFDEIQIIDGWEKFVRRLADTGYRLFVTGSNAKMLSKEISTTLGGRFIVKEIYPLSFREYLKFNNVDLDKNWEYGSQRHEIQRQFKEYFYYGGFPELFLFKNKRIWLNNLYQKILYGDLIARYKIRNEFALKLLIKKMAESVHDEVSFTRVKNIINSTGITIGITTVIDYLTNLKSSYLLFDVENYFAKVNDKESKKKYYFIDNGIITLFLNNPDTILLENLVAVRLKQKFGNQLYYLKKQTEVDFYIPDNKTLIQVSYNISDIMTEKREISALLKLSKLVEVERFMIITRDQEKRIETNGIVIDVIPVWKWLLQ
jgi:predicted AAA+ superfamily ATPase